MKLIVGETEPALSNNTACFWRDTTSNKTYLVIDVAGTQYKVEAA